MIHADVAAIIAGRLTHEEALWQVGREMLCSTSQLLAVAARLPCWTTEYGGRSTNSPGHWLEYNSKDVHIRSNDGDVLFRATWASLAAIIRPHLTGHLLDAVRDTNRWWRDWHAARPPCWRARHLTPGQRQAEWNAQRAVGERCDAAVAAVWDAARNVVQLDLFGEGA